MAITNESELIAARLAGDRFVIDKASNANQTSGSWSSLWLSTGIPTAGATPGAAAICTKALAGAIPFTNAVLPEKNYLSDITLTSPTGSQVIEVWDRIAHIGGMSLNVGVTTQASVLDLSPSGLNPSVARTGNADLSEIDWWLETYSDGGGTASNATVNVTFTDATSNNLNVLAVGGTLRARRLFRLRDLRQTADVNRVIQKVNSVTLTAATGTAGIFGFTATRRVCKPIGIRLSNFPEERDYQGTGLYEIPTDACLMLGMFTVATSTNTLRGLGLIANG